MDQDLHTVFGRKPIGMECFRNGGNFAVHRRVDLAIGGNDGDAVTHRIFWEKTSSGTSSRGIDWPLRGARMDFSPVSVLLLI